MERLLLYLLSLLTLCGTVCASQSNQSGSEADVETVIEEAAGQSADTAAEGIEHTETGAPRLLYMGQASIRAMI